MRWGAVVSGPDMQDCCKWLQSVEETHKCECSLLLLPDGEHAGTRWRIDALAVRPTPLGVPLGESIGVFCYFPDGQSKTFEGALMRLIVALDTECTRQWWVQGRLLADLV
jgi:hypothetical protein